MLVLVKSLLEKGQGRERYIKNGDTQNKVLGDCLQHYMTAELIQYLPVQGSSPAP